MDADRHVHPRPAPRSTPQRLKIESTGGHPCSRHGVTTPPTDRHRADDAVTATITPSRWRPTPPSSSSSKVTASSPFSVPGKLPDALPISHLDFRIACVYSDSSGFDAICKLTKHVY